MPPFRFWLKRWSKVENAEYSRSQVGQQRDVGVGVCVCVWRGGGGAAHSNYFYFVFEISNRFIYCLKQGGLFDLSDQTEPIRGFIVFTPSQRGVEKHQAFNYPPPPPPRTIYWYPELNLSIAASQQ